MGGSAMARAVHLHLQHGFAEDTVTIAVDGRPVFRRDHVTTSLLTALALVAEVEVPDGGATLDVEVPTRRLRQQVALHADGEGDAVLTANIVGGHLEIHRVRNTLEYE